MKEKFKKIQFLVYAVLLFVIAPILESYLSGLRSFDIDSDRVEAVLHEKEIKLDSALGSISADVSQGHGLIKDGRVWLLNRDFESLKNEGLTVFVFENDTLRLWTDNVVASDVLFSQSALNNRIANLGNAWYEIRILEKGGCKYVGLVFLKNKYAISNRYLKNDFLSEFQLGSSVQVSMIPLSYGFDIKDKEGKYIFSLVPTNSYDIDGDKFNLVGVFYLAALMMLLFFVYQVIERLSQAEGNSMKIVAVISGVIVVRFLLLLFKFPPNIYKLDFYDPEYFLGPGMFKTIGDFIINSVFLFAIIVYLFMLADYRKVKQSLNEMSQSALCAIWAMAVVVFFMVFGYLYHVTTLLVGEGKVSFQLTNIMSLDIFSYSGILIMVILTGTLVYTVVKMTEYFHYTLIRDLKRAVIIYCSASLALFLLFWLVGGLLTGLAALYGCILIGSGLSMHYHKAEANVYRYVFMLFCAALFSCALITITTSDKISNKCHDLVTVPLDEHDQFAETLLKQFADKLSSDDMITEFLRKSDSQARDAKLRDYLQHQYFYGYWSKYNLSISVLELEPNEQFSTCDDPFAKLVTQKGREIEATGFCLVDKPDGTVSYCAPLKYPLGGRMNYVCITLDSKPVPQELGYPELLLDDNIKPSEISSYNYAKYRNGRKVSQNGKLSYDFTDQMYLSEMSQEDTISVLYAGDYIHTVYHSGADTIVLSRRSMSLYDFITQFSYIFVMYVVVMLIVLVVRLVATHHTDYRYQIKTRLIFSVAFILMLSFVFICIGTMYMNYHRFQSDNNNSIDEKVKSVYMELQRSCGDTLQFASKWDPNKNGAMDEYLVSLSHIFFIDINLYGTDGMLIASSRPEVFKQGLVSTRISTTALGKFVLGNKSNYIQQEKIGKMSYASAYIPFYNNSDNLAAYINLPYFTKPELVKKELGTLLVSIINLYVVLMMISIVVAVIISERIVQPIKLIQSKMEKIELGKQHEKIEYDRKDELGQLVAEYNNMAEKLEESAKLLAQGERESAWREMAKQIAHEIKNPLTPMKLSIQFLMRSKENNDGGFDSILQKVSNTLIQQIDTLSSIATGFSNFAKMPKPDEHPFNVVETLSNVIQLFNNVDNMDITSDLGGYDSIIIVADKEQISRVFINLIKNATQAIPEGVRGKIHVTMECGQKLVIKIADNGCGIPDEIRPKLFTPSFTTKSSGSGLGLAMVKNIIINAKGDITFESEVGKGTTFIITLPVSKAEKS